MINKHLPLISLFIIFSISIIISNGASIVHEISEEVLGDSNHKKADITIDPEEQNYYFKYSFSTIPSSRISAFRLEFDQFDPKSSTNEVFCTFLDESASDSEIINALDSLTRDTSVCIGTFKEIGIFDGIFKHNQNKTKFAILLKNYGEFSANARVYVRYKETNLTAIEQEVKDSEIYSIIPYSLYIPQFREKGAAKILLYSKTRELQMYYVEGNSPYPERIIFGNIMSIYTNPNMVRQKYNNAIIMVLLIRPFDAEDPLGEVFQFQVKFLASDFFLDYYIGSNPDGREKNSPLAINMTECSIPYYIILNYNKPESKDISLYIDKIYGKIKSLSIAPTISSDKWEDMITNDFLEIDLNAHKYELTKNSQTHMDIYKVECTSPSLINFYYVDESAKIPELDYGLVTFASLKANKVLSFPFASGIEIAQLTIEVYNPTTSPFVMINEGINEYIVNKNSLIKTTLLNTNNAIVVKERGGNNNTTVIIKVSYNILSWEEKYDNVVYNEDLNTYVFSFPVDAKNKFRTHALLQTSGNSEDNAKYCYGANIGSAILPSSENCYIVSSKDPYTLKIINPAIMYKDYDLDETLIYYVSLKPTKLEDVLDIKVTFVEYDSTTRNVEAKGNVVQLNSTTESTILSYSEIKEEKIFCQITSCSSKYEISYSILNAFTQTYILKPNIIIPENTVNYFFTFNNTYGDAQLILTGIQGDKIFVKHKGIDENYSPNIKPSYPIVFDQSKNSIIFTSPFNNIEKLTYTVYISKEGELSSNELSLCTFIDSKEILDSYYSYTFTNDANEYTLPINFNKISLKEGDKFEAISFIEQDLYSQMSFVTNLLTGTVGEIKEEIITPITTVHPNDIDYIYYQQEAKTETSTFYYSFINTNVFDVPIGVFRIELDADAEGSFGTVYCAWVDEDADAISMVDAIDEVIKNKNSYCLGGKNKVDNKRYNYMFKYTYTNDNLPRKLVIKIPEIQPNTGFNIFIREGENTQILQTDFSASEEYGRQEEFKLSLIPYILDLPNIRGDDTYPDYVSKILIYSKYFEMQMYYISDSSNSPIRLFIGNVMLVLTKPSLAQQKYFSTKLILFSEHIRGQEHSVLGNSFRFHTKMLRSSDQIEYFVSANPQGRTLNFPLSLKMDTCTGLNNKYYYILNYNTEEEQRNLYLNLIYGSMNNARIVTELTEEKWDDLINNKMEVINDYFTTIPIRSQHIDIVEITCATPLLINAYYNNDNYPYSWVSQGDVVVKNIASKESFTFYLDTSSSSIFYYSIEVFNPRESPNIVVNYNSQVSTVITENSLIAGFLFSVPESINVVNKGNTQTRFIFKVGFEVETSWKKEEVQLEGVLYSKENKYVYKFPLGDKKLNFINVNIDVKPMKIQSEPLSENIKFCYSTNLGMPIKSSQENCFRTGANIPYSLTFINPLIISKPYKSSTDNYYITLTPQKSDQYISLNITENKYDTKYRNIEGAGNIITLESSEAQSTILTVPEDYTNNIIIVQLQACICSSQNIQYVNKNAYTLDYISSESVNPSEKLYFYKINNNLMEIKIEFTGALDDKIFVKHSGIKDYDIKTENYYASFDQNTNTVNIIKPIFNEEFIITVLVGPKDHFNDFTLCTFAEKKQQADYIFSFSSVGSNEIPHEIDFKSFNYKEGTEFDLLVYAVQKYNSKLEFLYPVISGVVGKIEDIFIQIEGIIDSNIVTQNFTKKDNNYLYYDFMRSPVGDVASLKIINGGETNVTISKIICAFSQKETTEQEMLNIINSVAREGINLCKGDEKKDLNGYDAIINAENVKGNNKRLIIMIQYGFSGDNEENENSLDDDAIELTINLRTTGFDVVASKKEYNEDENKVLVPYVFDLKKIRGDEISENYISKILIYSSKRELEMFHLKDGAPSKLFSGNIVLLDTNDAVIKANYHGATSLILLTESLFKDTAIIIGEKFRFKTYFFKSDTSINYFMSSNPEGRPINTPLIMDLPSCDMTYYYILNYHYPDEREVTLHIDKIYGQINTTKISTQFNKDDWYDLIDNMEDINGYEYLINQHEISHIDVIEVTCKIPTLLDIYFTDNENPFITGLAPSDTSIVNLGPNESTELQLQTGVKPGYNIIYSFNILSDYDTPNIIISFPSGDPIIAKENAIYVINTTENFETINIQNYKLSGNSKTRIIFKYGYEIENKFEPIKNGLYHLNETDNLFGYKFKTEDNWLNYSSISFQVYSMEENVEFCYSTNLGSYMKPSLQNCYRVGLSNTHTITVLNPYLMFKDYKIPSEPMINYFIGFKTVDKSQNIIITPTLNNYDTEYRNFENIPSSVMIAQNGSTILTPPSEYTKYIFLQMQVCTPDKAIEYNLSNAYDKSPLNLGGNIDSNDDIFFTTFENIKLDTKLGMNVNTSSKIYIRHTGINEEYKPEVEKIALNYNVHNGILKFNQPISNEEFIYTIYIDRKDNLKKQDLTLCSIVGKTKIARYSKKIKSKEEIVKEIINFDSLELNDFGDYDILVLAEQVNKGKLMILSNLIQGVLNRDGEQKKPKDISTLSNYQEITINYIYGEFKIDFDKKIVIGNLNYNLKAKADDDKIIFDTDSLNIKKVYQIIDADNEVYEPKPIEFKLGEKDDNLGTPLIMDVNYKSNEIIQIKIEYETTTKGSSAQFLTKEQTFGKEHPYFFTQSEMILGRSLFPCQDTPSVKFVFDLSIIVPKDLKGMISGIYKSEKIYSNDENYKIYYYEQEIPIPSYLVSLAAGNIVNKSITENITVFSEPEFIDNAYNETKEDLPKAIELAVNYMGPYLWQQYNILVLPRSFPYSGMENPSLSFLSPCLINGDKSLIDIIFHEMIHSWSGNLVTNDNWSDFWLNEGITMFLQRKIIGLWKKDPEYARMDGYLGFYYIQQSIDYFGEKLKDFTTLRPNLEGFSPDDYYSDIPYEKGYNFIYYIESLIGEDIMESFFKNYFEHFKYLSINFYQFKNYFIDFCLDNNVTNDTLNKINWTAWVFTPGDIPVNFTENNKYKDQVEEIIEKIKKGNFENLENEFAGLYPISKTYILLTFQQFDGFLTDEQHKFFTETLKLYEGQNFLVSTNYFRLILEKTDKFLEHELDSLINYLSNYGATDYMVGLYELFYKRDEIKAKETLNNLSTFYHSLMYEMALEEIEKAEDDFPILALDIKSNSKIYYPYDDIFELNVEKYDDDLGKLYFVDNIYLMDNSIEFGLNCYLNSSETQYCELKNETFESKGQYSIKVKERIQKMDYAVKVHESEKFEIIQFLNREETKTKYTFNVAKDNILKIIINLNEVIDFDLPVYFGNNTDLKLKCEIHEINYECELNKTFCESHCKIQKEEVKYEINVLSKSEKSFLNIEVYINSFEEKEQENDSDILVIVLPCVFGAILIIGIVLFCILRKKRQITSEEITRELISVGLKDSEMKEGTE